MGQVGSVVGQVGTEVGPVTEVKLTHRMLWLALNRVSRPHRTYGGMGWHSAAEVAEEVGVAEQVSALPEIPSVRTVCLACCVDCELDGETTRALLHGVPISVCICDVALAWCEHDGVAHLHEL